MRLAALILAVALTGCSTLGTALGGVFGGGTNAAANVQAGEENKQTGVVVGKVTDSKVEAKEIGALTQADQNITSTGETTIQNIPPWVILLLLLGWLLPTPSSMWKGFVSLFPKKRKRKKK